jgi:hypothetical protein
MPPFIIHISVFPDGAIDMIVALRKIIWKADKGAERWHNVAFDCRRKSVPDR